MTIVISMTPRTYTKPNTRFPEKLAYYANDLRRRKLRPEEKLLIDTMSQYGLLDSFHRRRYLYVFVPFLHSPQHRLVIDIIYPLQHENQRSLDRIARRKKRYALSGWNYCMIDSTNVLEDVDNCIAAIETAMSLHKETPCPA